MISKQSIDTLKAQVSLLSIAERYTSMKRMGKVWKGCCPFHDEKTPSFSIKDGEEFYKCFGCGEAGDIFSMVQTLERTDFIGAARMIAEWHGITLQQDTTEAQKAYEASESLYVVMKAAAAHYHGTESKKQALEYLMPRGISEETINTFEIGCSGGWHDLKDTLDAKHFLPEMMELAGLIRKGDKGFYDFFRERIMFPIKNPSGHVVAFGARARGDEQPKYLNSPETPVYKKERMFYGLFEAKAQIRKEGAVFITEGYIDVLAMHQAGLTNTVATCGTAVGAKHMELLKTYCQSVILLFDADKAGIKAANKAIEEALRLGMGVRVIMLPEGTDPADYALTRGGDALVNYCQTAQQDFLVWTARTALDDAGHDPIKRANAIAKIRDLVQLCPDAVVRAVYYKQLAEVTGLDASVFDTKAKSEKAQTKAVPEGKFISDWIKPTTDADGNYKDMKFDADNLLSLLRSLGVLRYDLSETDYTFLIIKDNIAREAKAHNIRDELEIYVRKNCPDTVLFETKKETIEVSKHSIINKLIMGLDQYTKESRLSLIRPEAPVCFMGDAVDKSYFYYKNGIVAVNSDGVAVLPYHSSEAIVWKNRIVDRVYTPMAYDYAMDIVRDDMADLTVFPSFFARFCYRVSHSKRDRFLQLCSIIGYVMHDYFHTKRKAIVFTDSGMSDKPEGRTGKTLLGRALGMMRTMAELNGKNFRHDDPRRYQTCKMDTQLVNINDLPSYIDTEGFYNDISEGILVDQKNEKPFHINARLLLSTNKSLRFEGSSGRDRFHEFEFANHYSDVYSPYDEFGHWFFRDWVPGSAYENQWQAFDNFMMWCVSWYFKNGLLKADTVNLEDRKLRDHTSPEFVEWMQTQYDMGGIKHLEPVPLREFLEGFLQGYPDFRTYGRKGKPLPERTMMDWIEKWVNHQKHMKNFDAVKHKKRENSGTVFQFEHMDPNHYAEYVDLLKKQKDWEVKQNTPPTLF